MGKRFAIVIGVAALGAALIAVGASANFRSVDDLRGHVKCHHDTGSHRPCSDSKKRNADIVRATAGHGWQGLKHTIRVVGKFKQGELWINTDSGPGCDYVLAARRGRGVAPVRECDSGLRTGRARYVFNLHSVEIFFRKRSIGNPQSYGWRAYASAGGHPYAIDRVRNGGGFIRHRFGVAAAGVMALGAQTAASGVDRVPPDLKLFGPKRQDPQNDPRACDGSWCDVVVRVSCRHRKCTVRVRGRLTNVKNNRLRPEGPWVVKPGHHPQLGPSLTHAQQRQVRRALRRDEKVKAKVTFRARDAAGNVATAKRTIRLVKNVRG